MPRVQVFIPAYNYGRYLTACVDSVLAQTGVELDVLIIDDCSSDDTPDVCGKLQTADKRIRVIRHETNKGHIATYNEAIAQIRGDYFQLLSADDLLTPGALARATALMEAKPSMGMVYGQPISLYGDTLPPARTRVRGWSVWPGRRWIELVCRAGKNFVTSPEALVRTSIQERIGGYEPTLPHSADMEQWLRIAAIADIGRIKGADQAYYRIHAASMQRTIYKGTLFDLVGRREAFRSTFEKEGASLPGVESLHARARHELAITALRQARRLCDAQPHDADAIDAYCDFALSTDDGIEASRQWRALRRARNAERSAFARMVSRRSGAARALIERAVIDRIEFHRARHTGIYLPR